MPDIDWDAKKKAQKIQLENLKKWGDAQEKARLEREAAEKARQVPVDAPSPNGPSG